ncbi:F0F1 ATP synthase subunit gamma [Candidatus Omnitrophota bacterium]
MSKIADVKKDMEFYQDFASLIEALKAITISQFHAIEKKIRTFDEFAHTLERFFELIDINSVRHPFVQSEGSNIGVVAITSDSGLLGGLNNRVMFAALNYLRNRQNKLIVVGTQGQRIASGSDIPFESFPGAEDEQRYSRALELRNYIVKEVLYRRIDAVKVIYPFATSITRQKIIEIDLLPCTEWPKDHSDPAKNNPLQGSGNVASLASDFILESSPGRVVEYLAYLWIGHRLYEILQFSRLAEYAARIIHLEESSQKIKEIDQKLKLRYFRMRHEIIDQQMRELFSARSLYAG